jgi:UDP-glucose 4-epimerase
MLDDQDSDSSSNDACLSPIFSSLGTPETEKSCILEDICTQETLPTISPNSQFILVVGGLGYIGSHTTLELVKAGYNVVVLDNLSNSFRRVFSRLRFLAKEHYQEQPQLMPLMEFCEADFRDSKAVRGILCKYDMMSLGKPFSFPSTNFPTNPARSRISGVIHFAGYKSVEESIGKPLKYYANNVGGVIDFCTLLDNFGIKTFVFSSSATVYGEVANIGRPLREEHCSHRTTSFIDDNGHDKTVLSGCTGLTNPYGRTKWMCEAILADLAAADPTWTIIALRYFNPVGCDSSGLLGEDPRTEPSNLMPIVTQVLTGARERLNVFGTDYNTFDGTAIRDFIHVTDLAKGHIAALSLATRSLQSNEIPPLSLAQATYDNFKVFNLGSGNGYSVLDVVTTMQKVSKREIPTQLVARREGDIGLCVASTVKAREELDWRTEKTLENSCEDICRFLMLDVRESAAGA